MHINNVFLGLASLSAVAEAWTPPTYTNFNRVWFSSFVGAENELPASSNWNYITGDRNDNNEWQRYTTSSQNLKLSGQNTLQIIPRRDASAPRGWTSARIESKPTVTPADGKLTRIEASVRVGNNAAARKQGIWPAVWMMGDAFRKGTPWPQCGELDLYEQINGQSVVNFVGHCDVYPGGLCQEPVGLVNVANLPDSEHHIYRMEVDRRNSNFRQQKITWYMDGAKVHEITGAVINNSAVWASLAHSPFFFIVNVAVGGNWPGDPNAQTLGGIGSVLELGYVAHYVSV